MLRVSETYWAGKRRLLQLLAELELSGPRQRTLCFTRASLASRNRPGPISTADPGASRIGAILEELGEPQAGAVVFLGERQAIAVVPPFPVVADESSEGVDASPLRDLMDSDLLIGVVLLRLRRYAVGVLRGESLIASKTESRYVKNRHRAGGSSQRRFERSRERLVRELFDRTCESARDVFSPYGDRIDYFLMGGERHTLRGFVERCRYLRDYEHKTLTRLLQVDSPNQEALGKIAFEVWKSRVFVFSDSHSD